MAVQANRPNMSFRSTPLGGDFERDTDQTPHQPQPSQLQTNPGANPSDYWKNLLAVRPDNIKINFTPMEANTNSAQPTSDTIVNQSFNVNGELLPVFEADPWEKLQKLIDTTEQTQIDETLKVFGINQDTSEKQAEKESKKPEALKPRGWKDITKDYINFNLFFKEVLLKTPKTVWKFLDLKGIIYGDLLKKQMVGWGGWKKTESKKEGDKKPKIYPGFFRNLGGRGTEILRKLGLQRKSVNQKVGFSNDAYIGTVDDNFQVRADISIMLDKPNSEMSAADLAAKRTMDIQKAKGKKGVNQKGQFEGSTAGGSAHTSAITAGG